MMPCAEVLCIIAPLLAMLSRINEGLDLLHKVLILASWQIAPTIENAGLVGLYKGSSAGKRHYAAIARVPRCHPRAACCLCKADPACCHCMRAARVHAWGSAVPNRRPWYTCTCVPESETCL